jgi:hypothetical protein
MYEKRQLDSLAQLHRNHRAAGSNPVRGPACSCIFAADPAWLGQKCK